MLSSIVPKRGLPNGALSCVGITHGRLTSELRDSLRVAAIVRQCSDSESPDRAAKRPWHQRKQAYLPRVKAPPTAPVTLGSPSALSVEKVCAVLASADAVVSIPPIGWKLKIP